MKRQSLLAAVCLGAAWLLAGGTVWPLNSLDHAREFRDDVGRKVVVPDKPARVVSLAPNITEILFALGAGDLVVGVTDYCDYPPEARERARVGGFVNPSLEVIVSLKPDLVIGTADGNRPADVLQLERLGLPVFVIDTRTVDDIYRSIRTMGDLVGREVQAADLTAAMAGRRAGIRERSTDLSRPAVLFIVGRKPLVGVGPGTFLHQLILEAGGVNALASSPVKYPLLGMESVLAADPDVIILDVMEKGAALEGEPAWEKLRAVREGRVFEIRDDTILRPGPRVMEGLELLTGILHPVKEEEKP